MAKTKKSRATPAEQLLQEARRLAASGAGWIAVHNALFGIAGLAIRHFPSESARTTFSKTDEFSEIWELIEKLQGDKPFAGLPSASGYTSLRIPVSLHAALLKEAEVEGVSLNQLCLSKLAIQLRAAV